MCLCVNVPVCMCVYACVCVCDHCPLIDLQTNRVSIFPHLLCKWRRRLAHYWKCMFMCRHWYDDPTIYWNCLVEKWEHFSTVNELLVVVSSIICHKKFSMCLCTSMESPISHIFIYASVTILSIVAPSVHSGGKLISHGYKPYPAHDCDYVGIWIKVVQCNN